MIIYPKKDDLEAELFKKAQAAGAKANKSDEK